MLMVFLDTPVSKVHPVIRVTLVHLVMSALSDTLAHVASRATLVQSVRLALKARRVKLVIPVQRVTLA